ncbi:hypothetical protein [Streptomyces sp. NPDC051567]|uniref:hypothetical protein n=1 Tax=Streptomyces sp. NPDC051567 TaxID=3365660 RepID=UPI0037AB9CE0
MRVRAFTITVAVTALLATACGSSPGEELGDWYTSGGEKQIKQMAQDAGRVSEVSMRTLDAIGTACQDLTGHLPAAEGFAPIPDETAQSAWSKALAALRAGAAECTAGAAAQDEVRAGAGVRTIQRDGLGVLPEVTSRIKAQLAREKK